MHLAQFDSANVCLHSFTILFYLFDLVHAGWSQHSS